MIDPKHFKPQNTTISAIAVLEEVYIERHRSGFETEWGARCNAIGRQNTSERAVDILPKKFNQFAKNSWRNIHCQDLYCVPRTGHSNRRVWDSL